MSSILKIFKQHLLRPSWKSSVVICYLLPNSKSDWVEMVEGIGASWRFRIAKMVPFWYSRWPPWQPSWKSSNHICYRTVSLIELQHDGRHWGVMEFRIAKVHLFQCPRWLPSWNSSNQTVSQVEAKLDGRHQGDMEIQNCCIVQFQYPRWQPWWQSWNSSKAKGNRIW